MSEQPLSGLPSFGAEDILRSQHSGDLLRFQRLLRHPGGFQLILAAYNLPLYRDSLIAKATPTGFATSSLSISRDADPANLVDQLHELSSKHRIIHLFGMDEWLHQAGTSGLHALNYRREKLAAEVQSTLVIWLSSDNITALAREAPDLWAWRSAVLDFSVRPVVREQIHRDWLDLRSADREKREQRLATIYSHLDSKLTPSTADAALLIEAARILIDLGKVDQALTEAQKAKSIYSDEDDRLGMVSAMNTIVDAHYLHGNYDQALSLLKKDVLPVFENLGDIRACAVTLGKIADIHFQRCDYDQALHIRQKQLPVFEQVGDIRAYTVSMGKIADIHELRGDHEQALLIRTEEELPVYKKLGDIRSQAMVMAKIADIHSQSENYDQALQILYEQLPVFEKLGDIRAYAVTLGKIADIHFLRGNYDQALHIRQDEELPVYKKLGDIHSYTITIGNIADIHFQRGDFVQALTIRKNEELPAYEKLGDTRSYAITLGGIADIHFARGDYDQALHIRQDQELPAYEELGTKREALGCRIKLALTHLARNHPSDRQQAKNLLCLSLKQAKRHSYSSEVQGIRNVLKKAGLRCT